METRTRFVFLMTPKEFKREKAATGRLTHLCLPNSEIRMGQGFDGDETVQALINDPRNFPVLLYPGTAALNLSEAGRGGAAEPFRQAQGPGLGEGPRLTGDGSPYLCFDSLRSQLEHRQLVVFLLDATWRGARKMLRESPSLQRLPRIMFTPSAPSRYVIKQQPVEGCLSTLEAVHELLTVLVRTGLDRYPLPDQLLEVFQRMQDFQIKCAADPNRGGYRRHPYSAPEERAPAHGRSGRRRTQHLRRPLLAKGKGAA